MIEIRNDNGTWEAWICGRIWDYNDNLEVLLKTLARQAEEIENDINE
ncbi:hypothetical protein [Flavobacterium sp.]